jgi:hypothetical protein
MKTNRDCNGFEERVVYLNSVFSFENIADHEPSYKSTLLVVKNYVLHSSFLVQTSA